MNGGPVYILLKELSETYPTQDGIQKALNNMTEEEAQDLEAILSCINKTYNFDYDDIKRCYDVFVKDTLVESKYFLDNGKYRCSTYEEANKYMYSKEEHYMRSYQVGIILSLFIWERHSEERQYFLDILKNAAGNNYLEIGVGHGYYFSLALQHTNFKFYRGIDLNQDSVNMANALVETLNKEAAGTYSIGVQDLFNLSTETTYDAIICGEVLEHVEKPQMFLEQIRSLSNENTLIYITTAINAPEIDHITLFSSPDEVAQLFSDSGLTIVDMKLYLYRNCDLEKCLKRRRPILVSIVAKRRR